MANDPARAALHVWQITDGNRGHEVQVEGLIAALRDRLPVLLETTAVQALPSALSWRWQAPTCDPDLVIGAGHATHGQLLAARWRAGLSTLVLMKPSLPRALFSYCITPRHDGLGDSARCLATDGSLNPLRLHTRADPREGLLLIGGPSRHVQWQTEPLLQQIRARVSALPGVQWQLSSSRRTPADFLPAARAALADLPVQVLDWQQLPPDWLRKAFAHAAFAWISNDSVNMIYEALTAGLRVGLLCSRPVPGSRVMKGVQGLVQRGWLAHPEQPSLTACQPPERFNEADRAADWLLARLRPAQFLETDA